jgi:hypothetical protein
MAQEAAALSAGLRRLWELGAGTSRIVRIVSAESDGDVLERIEAAIRELEAAQSDPTGPLGAASPSAVSSEL